MILAYTSWAWLNLILTGFFFGLGFAIAGWLWAKLTSL